jgi:histidyl-tRNA synthetase
MTIANPKGTRDFIPTDANKREYIFQTIKNVFQRYGFEPIETPAIENLSTLLGKYGDEGDKLVFKILNSGDFFKGVPEQVLQQHDTAQFTSVACEKGLRYDLTVPLARFVAQHRNEITLPFKRYQIQPVWRADRPQKGRYREFTQCDGDIVGSNSLLNEVEIIQIINDVFTNLHVPVTVHVNNRKILAGIANYIGEADKLLDITTAIDKLDKIGIENVAAELISKGVHNEAVDRLIPLLQLQGSNNEKLNHLQQLINDPIGATGIQEAQTILHTTQLLELNAKLVLDLTLARGLNYYTGTIIEVKADNVDIGSISGGGRYDNLTETFGLKNVSGVGVSFGADRIFDVLQQLKLFPDNVNNTQILFTNFGAKEINYTLPIVKYVRQQGVNAELYPDASKIKKQLEYANHKQIPFVAFTGETEIAQQKVTVKNMITGEQKLVSKEELVEVVKGLA